MGRISNTLTTKVLCATQNLWLISSRNSPENKMSNCHFFCWQKANVIKPIK